MVVGNQKQKANRASFPRLGDDIHIPYSSMPDRKQKVGSPRLILILLLSRLARRGGDPRRSKRRSLCRTRWHENTIHSFTRDLLGRRRDCRKTHAITSGVRIHSFFLDRDTVDIYSVEVAIITDHKPDATTIDFISYVLVMNSRDNGAASWRGLTSWIQDTTPSILWKDDDWSNDCCRLDHAMIISPFDLKNKPSIISGWIITGEKIQFIRHFFGDDKHPGSSLGFAPSQGSDTTFCSWWCKSN